MNAAAGVDASPRVVPGGESSEGGVSLPTTSPSVFGRPVCGVCSRPGRLVLHGETPQRFHQIECDWIGCRRKHRRDPSRYCSDACAEMAAAQEERVQQKRQARKAQP